MSVQSLVKLSLSESAWQNTHKMGTVCHSWAQFDTPTVSWPCSFSAESVSQLSTVWYAYCIMALFFFSRISFTNIASDMRLCLLFIAMPAQLQQSFWRSTSRPSCIQSYASALARLRGLQFHHRCCHGPSRYCHGPGRSVTSLGPVMLLVVFFVLGSVPQYTYRLYFVYNIIHDDHTFHISTCLSISSPLSCNSL